jgi:hypothetical protein
MRGRECGAIATSLDMKDITVSLRQAAGDDRAELD